MDVPFPNKTSPRSIFWPAGLLFPKAKPKAKPSAPSPGDLVANPWAALEDKADPFVPTATFQIYDLINRDLARAKDTHINRASSAIRCVKQRWYQGKGFPAKAQSPRTIVNYFLGDLSERTMLHFIREGCVGPGKLYSEVDFGKELGEIHFQDKALKIYSQQELTIKIPFFERITGHADGFGKRNSDGHWELIECKSAANWGFNDFKTVGPKEYLKQSATLMRSDKALELGVESTRFFYLRKETGHLWDRHFNFDPQLWKEVIAEFKTANGNEEPTAPYKLVYETLRKKPTGRMIAGFPCSYCGFLEKCKGAFRADWKADQFGNKKPVYVFNYNARSTL